MAPHAPGYPASPLTLAQAVIATSTEPLVLLAGDLTVVMASASFCRAFDLDCDAIVGQRWSTMGAGEWAVPQVGFMLSAIAAGNIDIDVYEFELKRPGLPTRCLRLDAHRLDYDDDGAVRVLAAVADVTDARASARLRDDLLHEKELLIQEVQHRVANSLQIIASVLLQSARKVQSEETRGHLQSAHHRVMSIAAVQRQLSASRIGDVALQSYFTQLCDSLGASMIRDPARLSIEVRCDASIVNANTSVSLGLIVTELVINALKHAYPEHGAGKIVVDYHADGADWTLTVADDGIGMPPAGPDAAKSGLGTSIVQALTKQLQARIDVTANHPGTLVSIVHALIAANDEVGEARAVPAV